MDVLRFLCGMSLWMLMSVTAQDAQDDLQYTIVEELANESFVADLFQDSKIQQRYEASVVERMRFRFLAEPELPFTIEEDSGIIRTGGRIDRDLQCPSSVTCNIKLDVVLLTTEPLMFYEMLKVHVKLVDINDNWPWFPEVEVTHHILESALPGAAFAIPSAEDPDSGEFGVQGYQLISNSDKFSLDVKQKLDGSSDMHVKLLEQLDREEEANYRVKVVAFDGGNPPKSTSVDVVIMVQDANDNNPVFENSNYVVNISENTAMQTTILTVSARDQDSGLNGQIRYTFSDTTRKQLGHILNIKNTTGDIYVTGEVDYESDVVYHLSVIAKDLGPDSFAADTTVIVHVEDVNDNPPDITVNTLSARGTDRVNVTEDARLSTFVAHLMVVDRDSGRNGNVSCELHDNHFILQDLTQGEYKVVTWAPLDRETRAQFNLAVTCKDHGTEPQVSIKHIQISLTDVNDNSPVFNQASYKCNLTENNNVGAYVCQVYATDQDTGHNSVIKYRTLEDMENWFQVHPDSGVISAAAMFDHEKGDYKRFHVLAIDTGSPAKTGTSLVTVHITDQNDMPPTFSQPSYTFGIPENEHAGTEVGTVTASDDDGQPGKLITFSLVPSLDTINTFAIEPHTGRLTTTVSLDRELQAEYYVTIVATDAGIPPLSSSVTATVQVTDKNDNAPQFQYPSDYNNSVYISNHLPVGYVLTHVRAHDLDGGNNGKLSYQFSKGNEQDVFSIDPWTGAIKLNINLGEIEYEIYDLLVTVKDHGVPERTATANINIIVNSSHVFSYSELDILHGHNLTIVIAIACGLGLVIVSLVIAILLVLRHQEKDKIRQKHQFMSDTSISEDTNYKTYIGEITPGKSAMTRTMENNFNLSAENKNNKEDSFSLNASDVVGDCKQAGVGQFVLTQQDPDSDSAYSGESSNTDSGRGLSEEGDVTHRALHNFRYPERDTLPDARLGYGEASSHAQQPERIERHYTRNAVKDNNYVTPHTSINLQNSSLVNGQDWPHSSGHLGNQRGCYGSNHGYHPSRGDTQQTVLQTGHNDRTSNQKHGRLPQGYDHSYTTNPHSVPRTFICLDTSSVDIGAVCSQDVLV